MPTKRLFVFLHGLVGSGGIIPAAFAHSNGTHPVDPGVLRWNVDPWIAVGLIVAACLYGGGVHRLWRNSHPGAAVPLWKTTCFAAGLAVLVVALLSPVDTLGNELFFMHMVQHELLMLAAAPLIVLGGPLAVFLWAFPLVWRKRIARLVRARAIQGPWFALTRPFAAWSLHAIVLWAWHFPSLFQAGLADDTVHALQHLSFLVFALLFWSSLIGTHTRLRYGVSVLYILTTAIHTGILGALLTFSAHAWYPAYSGTTEAWGLTMLEDQQLGGLIMWIPAGFVFLFTGLAVAAKAIMPEWKTYRRPEAEDDWGQSR